MPVNRMVCRIAAGADAEAIHNLMIEPVRAGEVLSRTPEDIQANLANFVVADGDGGIVGCVALRDYGQGLFEVRSLVVSADHRGQRIGTHLVESLLDAARQRHARSVFALTYHPDLFRRLGFKVVPKEMFPHKVWADCSTCKKREACDEIALLLLLDDQK